MTISALSIRISEMIAVLSRASFLVFAFSLFVAVGCCAQLQTTPSTQDQASAKGAPGLSPAELAKLRPVVERNLKEVLARAYNDRDATAKDLDDEFKQCRFTRLKLGKLGAAVVVEHGITNRNEEMINLYVPRNGTYERIIAQAGFGPIVLNGSRDVPDLVFGGASGVCEASLMRYRYTKGKYVADACDQEYRDGSADDRACPIRRCEAAPNLPTFPNPLREAELQSH